MTPPTTPNQSSNAERAAVVNRHVTKRIEAVNECDPSDDPGAFDFVVEGDSFDEPALGLLASYLGAAATHHSTALDIAVDVRRVVVEVEGGMTRFDGGAVEPPGENDLWRATPTEQSRVRALIEAHTDDSADRLAVWRDRLVGDDVPFSMVPGLVGVDLLVTPRAALRDVTDD
ncbi:hypothetical protein [Salinigranum rubrum]|nr:hypothetical protein [Salinigranum rubrum]